MTIELFPLDVIPFTEQDIIKPIYGEDPECLKQVKVHTQSTHFQMVVNKFNFCRPKWFFCKLAFWRDGEWCLYYSRSDRWPHDQNPFPNQLEEGYRASKYRDCHYFDLTDGRPCDKAQQIA